MGDTTAIEWTHHTLNPWRGCSKVHAGCTHCYAEKNVGVKLHGIRWGEVWQGGQRVIAADSAWTHPRTWARAAAKAGVRRRVFCASLADVLEVPADVPDSLRDGGAVALRVAEARDAMAGARERLWDVIRQTAFIDGTARRVLPHRNADGTYPVMPGAAGLDWLLLTKRPENWHLVPEDVRPLVWLGTSVSDQETADALVPRLLDADGFRYRFVSAEPLVGRVDLSQYMWPVLEWWRFPYGSAAEAKAAGAETGKRRQALVSAHARFLDWVIVGGESGRNARPCGVPWVRSIISQCRDAGVPCFVKQFGSKPGWPTTVAGPPWVAWFLKDPKGGDMSEWTEDLRVREFPRSAP